MGLWNPLGRLGNTRAAAVGSVRSYLPFLVDSFTDVDGTPITSHAGESGHAWAAQIGSAPASPLTISGGSLYLPVDAPPPAGYITDNAPIADCYVECSLLLRSVQSNVAPGPIGRASALARTMYNARYSTTTEAWELYKWVAGAATLLQSLPAALEVGVPYTCGLKMVGTSISMVIGGVEQAPITDTTPELAGPGLCGVFQGGFATSPTTGLHITSILAKKV